MAGVAMGNVVEAAMIKLGGLREALGWVKEEMR